MKRTVTYISVAVLVIVIAFSAFLATRHPVSSATDAPSPLLGKVALFCAQGEESAQRLLQIGVPQDRVWVCGNLKHDVLPVTRTALVEQIALVTGKRPLLVAGSTLPDEERMLLAAWPAVLERVPDAILLIAPRHPQRFDEVFRLMLRVHFRHCAAAC